MTGSIKVEIGQWGKVWARPQRLVFGRRHAPKERALGETFLALGDSPRLSFEWFSLDEGTLRFRDGESLTEQLVVRNRSEWNAVQVWEGRDPVRVNAGSSYLVQTSTFFVGGIVDGEICGARIDVTESRAPVPSQPLTPGLHAPTVRPVRLGITPTMRNTLLARYHRYYRLPPHFDPQPTPWLEVATILGMIDEGRADADSDARRAAEGKAQRPITRLKQAVEAAYPGWLPPPSGTEKNFHDRLRILLEVYEVFSRRSLAEFDKAFPLALRQSALRPDRRR